MAIIEKDSYFKCVEFSNLGENIKLGVFVYETPNNSNEAVKKYTLFLMDKYLFNIKYNADDIFNSTKIDYNYNLFLCQLENNKSLIDNKKLKKLYNLKPINTLKRHIKENINKWNFLNIFNEFFCYCIDHDCLRIINDKCKYFFYLYLIDLNHKTYKKTDFLLMDFILQKYSSDDVFPVFKKLIKKKLNAHYITENRKIYKIYCKEKKYCDSIIPANPKNYKINGNFLEKYLTLILKLRQVITNNGVDINYINNIFFNIDYITYICIGHGVSYFKYYLYGNKYSPQKFHKLLIPNSKKLINMTMRYGWKEENLLKFNLPRWEKYNRLKTKKSKQEEDEELNPYFDFHLSLKDENYLIYSLSGRSAFKNDYIDEEGHYIYNFGQRITNRRAILILYKCGEDENCTSLKNNIAIVVFINIVILL